MKTKIVAILLLINLTFVFNRFFSQAFQEGRSYISLGYGVGNLGNAVINQYKNNVENFNFNYESEGPYFMKYEYGIKGKFGVGISAAYLKGNGTWQYISEGYTFNGEINRTGINLNVRANYHFGDHLKFDPYIGLGGGIRINKVKVSSDEINYKKLNIPTVFPLGVELTLGTRFMLTENIGVYTEVGIARTILQFGLTGSF